MLPFWTGYGSSDTEISLIATKQKFPSSSERFAIASAAVSASNPPPVEYPLVPLPPTLRRLV